MEMDASDKSEPLLQDLIDESRAFVEPRVQQQANFRHAHSCDRVASSSANLMCKMAV